MGLARGYAWRCGAMCGRWSNYGARTGWRLFMRWHMSRAAINSKVCRRCLIYRVFQIDFSE